jgi:hypothetical protein
MTAAKEEKERNFRLLISSYNDRHILFLIIIIIIMIMIITFFALLCRADAP